MKRPSARKLLGIALLFALKALSQEPFVNLDFEQAMIIPIPGSPYYPHAVYTSDALPGWNAYLGGAAENVIFYDDVSLGAAAISIHDAGSMEPVLEGSYTVLLQPSYPGGSVSAAVGQTGQIPPGTQSVRFYGTGAYTLTFAGQQIPLVGVGSGANYTIFGGDVSTFAGQTGELRFTGFGLLDNIQFSVSQIPEPSVLALSALGALLLGRRFLRGSG